MQEQKTINETMLEHLKNYIESIEKNYGTPLAFDFTVNFYCKKGKVVTIKDNYTLTPVEYH